MSDPPYLVYGANGVATAAGPSRAEVTSLACFFLHADGDAIDRYVDEVLNAISGGAVRYRAMSHHVLATFGSTVNGRSLTPPYSTMGTLDEQQAAFWLLVARVEEPNEPDGRPVAQRFLAHAPYLFVDNPLSLTIGREVNGFAKSWGHLAFEPPTSFAVDTFGGPFGRGERADRHRMCSMERIDADHDDRADDDRADDHLLGDLVELVDWLKPRLPLPRVKVHAVREVIDLLREGTTWGLFLRQLRATDDNLRAAYQEVAECQIDLSKVRGRVLPHAYRFSLEALDSCPIGEELGIRSQDVPFGIELTMELELRSGTTIWWSAAPTP